MPYYTHVLGITSTEPSEMRLRAPLTEAAAQVLCYGEGFDQLGEVSA